MRFLNINLAVLMIFAVIGCIDTKPQLQSKSYIYQSWAAHVHVMNGRYELAINMFDSIVAHSSNGVSIIPNTPMQSYIVALRLTNKNDRVKQLYNKLSPDNRVIACSTQLITDLVDCQPEAIPTDLDLADELARRLHKDQQSRAPTNSAVLDLISHPSKDQLNEESNRLFLDSVIQRQGFPTKSQVGQLGMHAVFMIIQHSDDDLLWQRNQLSNIQEAVTNGDMPGSNLAYLTDRISTNAGHFQIYGTQLHVRDSTVSILPVQDSTNLDSRRFELGMSPINHYLKSVRRHYDTL